MKIIEKKYCDLGYSQNTIYKFDLIENFQNMKLLLDSVIAQGYQIKKFIINYTPDHTNSNNYINYDEYNKFMSALSNCHMVDIDKIEFASVYKGTDVLGYVYPNNNMMRLESFQKKNNMNLTEKTR